MMIEFMDKIERGENRQTPMNIEHDSLGCSISIGDFASKVMITFLIVIVLVYVLIVIILVFVDTFFVVRLILVSKSAHLMLSWLPLFAESVLCLAHLVVLSTSEHGVIIITLVIENLFLL